MSDERPSKRQSGDGNYVGLVYQDTSSASHVKDSNGSRQRGAPPDVPMPYSSADDNYVTIQAPDGPPQPKPRKNFPKRPVSMVESANRSDALGVVHEGQKHSRGN